MALKVRYPKIDYSKIRAHWSPNIAFAQHNNATSIVPIPVETWLIKVMQASLEKLPAGDTKLREDIKGFIGQESQHFRQHRLFNKVIAAQGYPKLAEYEAQLHNDLEGFLKDRSLKFHLAYADGFEALGAVSGEIWFEQSDDIVAGADQNALDLWKWHMAEEFEHREVCFQVFHALYSRGLWNKIWNGYFYRIYGFLYATIHLNIYMTKARNYMFEVDKSKMTEAEKKKLDDDLKAFTKFQSKTFLPKLFLNFLPWYNPGKKRTPIGLVEYLKQYEGPRSAQGQVVENAA